MSVAKVDGFGVRITGTDTSANTENRGKFVRMYASEAITKGDLVALDLNATEPANGYGNHVMKAVTSNALAQHGIGIAAETISAASTVAPISIQVHGLCTFAKSDVSESSNGQLLAACATSATLSIYDTSEDTGSGGNTLPVAISVTEHSGDTAASVVFLLNPANL